MRTTGEHLIDRQMRRAAILVAVVAVLAVAAASPPVHRAVETAVDAAQRVIAVHPLAGAAVFVLLSAASAMVVFFSTAVVTPVAVEAFGSVPTLILLWAGWVLGGVFAWAIGRFLGPRVVTWFVKAERLRIYEERAHALVTFRHVVLFQLAVPSEIPGYVLGLAGCRFRTFVLGMALAELPFAAGAVYLGDSFVEGRYLLVLAIGLAGVAATWFALRLFTRHAVARDEVGKIAVQP